LVLGDGDEDEVDEEADERWLGWPWCSWEEAVSWTLR
jgi:hypothetical protein